MNQEKKNYARNKVHIENDRLFCLNGEKFPQKWEKFKYPHYIILFISQVYR